MECQMISGRNCRNKDTFSLTSKCLLNVKSNWSHELCVECILIAATQFITYPTPLGDLSAEFLVSKISAKRGLLSRNFDMVYLKGVKFDVF